MEKQIPKTKQGNAGLQETIKGPKRVTVVGQCRYCGKTTNRIISNIYVCNVCWVKVPKKIYI